MGWFWIPDGRFCWVMVNGDALETKRNKKKAGQDVVAGKETGFRIIMRHVAYSNKQEESLGIYSAHGPKGEVVLSGMDLHDTMRRTEKHYEELEVKPTPGKKVRTHGKLKQANIIDP